MPTTPADESILSSLVSRRVGRETREKVLALRASDPDLSLREIAAATGIHHETVRSILQQAPEEVPAWFVEWQDRVSAELAEMRGDMRRVEQQTAAVLRALLRLTERTP